MSIGFRLFLLTFLVFGVIWVSKFRSSDIAYWMRAPQGVAQSLDPGHRAGVGSVLDPIIDLSLRSPEVRPIQRFQKPEVIGSHQGLYADELRFTREDAARMTAEGPPDDLSTWVEQDPAIGQDDLREQGYVDEASPEDYGAPPVEDFEDAHAVVETEAFVETELTQESDAIDDRVEDSEEAVADAAVAETRTYKVTSKDTLGTISLKVLGTSKRWREILDLNLGLNPQALQIGQKIRVPLK